MAKKCENDFNSLVFGLFTSTCKQFNQKRFLLPYVWISQRKNPIPSVNSIEMQLGCLWIGIFKCSALKLFQESMLSRILERLLLYQIDFPHWCTVYLSICLNFVIMFFSKILKLSLYKSFIFLVKFILSILQFFSYIDKWKFIYIYFSNFSRKEKMMSEYLSCTTWTYLMSANYF